MVYEEYIAKQKKTCKEDFKIGKAGSVLDRQTCEEKCNKNTGCIFYFYTLGNWCALYSSCNQRRVTNAIGSTFKKGKPSEDLSGRCLLRCLLDDVISNALIRSKSTKK